MIRRAQARGADARPAVEQLVRRYDGFVQALLQRAHRPPGLSVEDAKQDFLERLLKDLPRVEEGRGRFRGWLAQATHSYVCNAWKRWWAPTNPERHTEGCDGLELDTPHDAERELLRAFAADTLRQAERLLRARTSNPERLERLRHFLPGPDMNFEEIGIVARRLGLTPVATRKAIHDLREQFRECLREAVADTLDADELTPLDDPGRARAVDRELLELRSSLFASFVGRASFAR
jgi:DNA-directed RNA polymerase specialized sigma24 family protein